MPDFYSRPGLMTSPLMHTDLFGGLPDDVGALHGKNARTSVR